MGSRSDSYVPFTDKEWDELERSAEIMKIAKRKFTVGVARVVLAHKNLPQPKGGWFCQKLLYNFCSLEGSGYPDSQTIELPRKENRRKEKVNDEKIN